MAESHPPGVAKPEKVGSVCVLEIALIRRDAQRTVLKKRIVTPVRGDFQDAALPVEIRI
jgi:hypothetical protein